ncbi:MAG: Na/Pi cotransporter family protein [Ruminococcaceae bacterium]|nr:Na/Pi cotransporter family protein [Oscillospiraceae bacterium]
MDIFNILSLLGGLALFLFGMTYMGNGLERSAGGALERILEKMTNNPIKGVVLGAVVTAVIQSSSATTVMVVGFVNSGIMKLSQAIGIIMGANIGTTATAWILSLNGLAGNEWYIQLFKPDSLSPIAAVVGLIMMMACKNDKKKEIGSIFLGFAILMFGMSMMSDAVAPLKNDPNFANLLLMFTNPALGVLAGALLTAIIQSSSASVGILQALSSTGALPYSAAMPIIMGQNIGTCATALISSVGANKNAKRTAVVHLYFNIIGTVIFLIGYYLIEALIGFSFTDDMVTAQGIATIHTVFNLITTVILLPFYKILGKLAEKTVRENPKKPKKEENPLLDERFLTSPTFALEQCVSVTGRMAALSGDAIKRALDLVQTYDAHEAEHVIKTEDEVDIYEDKLGTFLVKLSSKDLSIEDSQTATRLLHNIGDLERISDHAVNIQEAAKEMMDKKIAFSEDAKNELKTISNAVSDIIDRTIKALIRNDLVAATDVEPLEQVIDELKDAIRENHIRRLRDGKCTIELGFILSDLLTNYERVSDHCSNIAATMIKAAEQSYETHKYLADLKSSGDEHFEAEYQACKAKYAL